jgi:hypothetical protein
LAENPHATSKQVVEALAALPPAQGAKTRVTIELGSPDGRAAKTIVAHAAYTNGGSHVAKACHDHGVPAVIYIHIVPPDLESLRIKSSGNLIVIGHMTGDALGVAPCIAGLRRQGVKVDVLSDVLDPGAGQR